MRTKELNHRLETLEKARKTLKQKFVGLDHIIDEVIHLATPWFTLPEMQTKPVIINLWGLTGSGKSKLVRELISLLDFDDRSTLLDTSRGHKVGFLDKLENLYKDRNGQEHVILLDEFQHARTIDGQGRELGVYQVLPIWDLFDSGQIHHYDRSFTRYNLYDLQRQVHFLIERGVKAKNGLVIKGKKIVEKVRESDQKRSKINGKWFIPQSNWSEIYEELKNEFSSFAAFSEHMEQLDHMQTVTLLDRACAASLKPSLINCTKCLVFVVGNLDEAFKMSHNTNSDHSANNLRRQSEHISVSKIKESLLRRFRPEQVARLGNNHVIYPALGTDEFKQIVSMKLDEIKSNLAQQFGFKCSFESSVTDYILSEGVTPAHGARPLFGTISSVIEAQIPHLLLYAKQHETKAADRFIWGIKSNQIQIYQSNKVVLKRELFSFVDKLKQPKRDDKQALVAVHEAGHALLHYVLNNEVPEQIITQASKEGVGGFVERTHHSKIMNKLHCENELTILFGGIAAEELIFGKDHLSFGSESDLRTATELAKSAIFLSGIGSKQMLYSEAAAFIDETLRPTEESLAEVTQLLENSAKNARELIKKHSIVLKAVAKQLANEARITGAQFKQIIDPFDLETSKPSSNYRSILFDSEVENQSGFKALVNPSLNHVDSNTLKK